MKLSYRAIRYLGRFSAVYAVLKVPAKMLFRLTHHRITILGTKNIPAEGPVIFAANHQNALMDPLAIIFTESRQTVFLARADIFKRKWIARFLIALKILPVYRIRDGRDSLENNESIFDAVVELFKKGNSVGLFPEATHVGRKSMISHKKAVARMVFKAGQDTDWRLRINIVPVGIHYTDYYGFQRSLTVSYGPPIDSSVWFQRFISEGENNATLGLRDELYQQINKLAVNVPGDLPYPVFESIFNIFQQPLWKVFPGKPAVLLQQEQQITEDVTNHMRNNPQEKERVERVARTWLRIKSELQIPDGDPTSSLPTRGYGWLRLGILILLLPFSLWGIISTGWVFWLTRYPYRSKVKDPQFWSSISYVLSLVVYPVYLMVLGISINMFLPAAYAWTLILLSVPSGLIAWISGQWLIRMRAIIRIKKSIPNTNSPWSIYCFHAKFLKDFYISCMDINEESN